MKFPTSGYPLALQGAILKMDGETFLLMVYLMLVAYVIIYAVIRLLKRKGCYLFENEVLPSDDQGIMTNTGF